MRGCIDCYETPCRCGTGYKHVGPLGRLELVAAVFDASYNNPAYQNREPEALDMDKIRAAHKTMGDFLWQHDEQQRNKRMQG